MTYRLIIRIEAEEDITDAAIWYQGRRAGLGDEFLAEIDAASPTRCPIHGNIRACGVSRKCAGFSPGDSHSASSLCYGRVR
jgi:hypothetical protein